FLLCFAATVTGTFYHYLLGWVAPYEIISLPKLFGILGGLGLLLGLFGLAAVMLRAVWERTGELALLRAVGYRVADLQKLILIENVVLLVVGVGVGLTAAVISVIPNLVLGGQIGSARLWLMLAAVVAVGLIVAVLTTRSVARVPLISALRKE
ncbi:MAG: FtsX-like permease family protein, partial [Gemmataceae bacterium]